MTSDWEDTTSVASPPVQSAEAAAVRDRAYLVVQAGSNVGEMYRIAADEVVLGRGGSADIRLHDDGVSRFHCRVRVVAEGLQLEDLNSRNGTFVNGEKITQRVLSEGDRLQIGTTTILRFSCHDRLDESFQRRMFDAALRDGLTRCYNRRYFIDRLHSELRFALRHRSPLTLLLVDVDHFKQVNDQHGHAAGDRALTELSAALHDAIRQEDVLARVGGEELAILSRAISRADSLRFAERLRKTIAELAIEAGDTTLRITASIGVATLEDVAVDSVEQLMVAADTALYRAKHEGRNRVVACTAEMLQHPISRPHEPAE